jgi:hypothetical protein
MADAITTLITSLQNNKRSADNLSEPVHVPINQFIAALQEIEATLGPVAGNQSDNAVFAGPSTGPAAPPTFRLLVGSDLPNPSATTLGGVESFAAVANEFINAISTAGVPSAVQPVSTNLSDYSHGTWTPIDASGASLALTVNNAEFWILNNFVYVEGSVTYPSTASAAQAALGGLPGTVKNQSGAGGIWVAATNVGAIAAEPVINTTTFDILSNVLAGVTNATLSTAVVRFQGFFPTS